MAYKSFSQGGRFNATDFTDDSKRILNQGASVIEQIRALGEIKTQQSALLANNMQREFNASKASLDSAYRARIEQMEAVERIRRREADQRLTIASKDKQFADQQGKKALNAFATFSTTAANLIKEDKEEYIKQVEEDARRDAIYDAIGGQSDPEAEIGIEAQRGQADQVAAATNIQTNVSLSEGVPLSGLRNTLYGGSTYYKRAFQEQKFSIAALNFQGFIQQSEIEGKPVTVTGPNGEPKQVILGSAELRNNPAEYREALNVILFDYLKQNGFDDVDPAAVAQSLRNMVGLINTQINNQQDKQLIQIRVKSIEAVRSSLLRIDPDRLQNGDISTAFNLLKSNTDSYANALNILKDMLVKLPPEYEAAVEDFLRNGKLDPNAKEPLSITNEQFIFDIAEARAERIEANREEAEKQRAKGLSRIVDLYIEAAGPFVSDGELEGFKEALDKNDQLSNLDRAQMYQEFTTKRQQINLESVEEVKKDLNIKVVNNELTEADVREVATILGPEDFAEYMAKITREQGGIPGIPKDKMDAIEAEIKGYVKRKLIGSSVDDTPHPSWIPTANYAIAEFQKRYGEIIKDFPTLPPEKAIDQARADVLELISDKSEGKPFFVRQSGDAGDEQTQGYYPMFSVGTIGGPDSAFYSPLNEKQLEKDIEANPELLKKKKMIGDTVVSQIAGAVRQNTPAILPPSVYVISTITGQSVEDVVNAQLEAYGIKGVTFQKGGLGYVKDMVKDPAFIELLKRQPSEINQINGIISTGNIPPSYGSDLGQADRVLKTAVDMDSTHPELLTVIYLEDSEAREISGMNKSSNYETLKYIDNEVLKQFPTGDFTYREMFQQINNPALNWMQDALDAAGYLDMKPGEATKSIGMSPTVSDVIYRTGEVGSEGQPHLHVDQNDNPLTPENEQDMDFDPYIALEDYVIIDDPKFGEVSPGGLMNRIPPTEGQKYGAYRNRGGSPGVHRGWDYSTANGTGIRLKGGAVVEATESQYDTNVGDILVIRLPDGRRFRLIHGDAP